MQFIEKAIGVFDSGLGGISVLKELKKLMPNENYLYYGDSAFAPYGEKTKAEITERCKMICDLFIEKGVKAIVIACNTATSACVKELRIVYPDIPIVGMEPALKLVAQGKCNQSIIVMATRFTLKEKKFHELMSRYRECNEIIKLPCPELVKLVEQDQLDDEDIVYQQLRNYFDAFDLATIHSIVLGCTHFVFFKDKMQELVGRNIQIVDGNAGTARHVMDILQEKNELVPKQSVGHIAIFNSSASNDTLKLSEKLLNR